MEQVRRETVAVDVEEWAGRFPPDQAEIASVRDAELKFRIFKDNPAVNAVARSAGSG
jgi:hypothetical protein